MGSVKSSELNKHQVRLFVDAVLNEGRLELLDELVGDDYVGHIPCAQASVVGRDELRRLLRAHRLAHPDLYIKVEEEVAEDDLVVIRWRATVASPGNGRRPNDPPVSEGISVVRLLAGRQVDGHTALGPSGARSAGEPAIRG